VLSCPAVRALATLALCLLVLGLPRVARADLLDDATRAADALAAQGARILRRESHFLEQGKHLELGFDDRSRACLTLILLAPRTTRFALATSAAEGSTDALLAALSAPRPDQRSESQSGLVQRVACGAERDAMWRGLVRMRSVRGAVELVLAASDEPAAELDPILVGRGPEPVAPRGDPGPALLVTSLPERRRAAELRARADGATNVLPVEMRSGERGTGQLTLRLPAGCHRFDVLAEQPAALRGRVGLDVDAELSDAQGQIVARDRGEAPDARLEACVGQVEERTLSVVGAPPSARIVVLDSIWPLGAWIPSVWGPRARAGFAQAARRRRLAAPLGAPIHESLGAQGNAQLLLPVMPGRCYFAAVSMIRGKSRGIRLSAVASAKISVEELSGSPDALGLTFCAEGLAEAKISVDVPGASLWWVLGVWELGSGSATGELSR
jgi:hypothetical protein